MQQDNSKVSGQVNLRKYYHQCIANKWWSTQCVEPISYNIDHLYRTSVCNYTVQKIIFLRSLATECCSPSAFYCTVPLTGCLTKWCQRIWFMPVVCWSHNIRYLSQESDINSIRIFREEILKIRKFMLHFKLNFLQLKNKTCFSKSKVDERILIFFFFFHGWVENFPSIQTNFNWKPNYFAERKFNISKGRSQTANPIK